MTRKSDNPSSRRHILVFDDDWEFLERSFGPSSESRLGVGPAIRQIIHIYVGNLRNNVQAKVDKLAKIEGTK